MHLVNQAIKMDKQLGDETDSLRTCESLEEELQEQERMLGEASVPKDQNGENSA